MRITKFGHSCLLIEEGGAKLLIDPGSYCQVPDVEGLQAVLVTHVHQDHLDIPTLKRVLGKNPQAEVVTQEEVGKALKGEGIGFRPIGEGEEQLFAGTSVIAEGHDHACIHHDLPLARNTGFLIAKRLWYPGDSFHVPPEPAEILALPVAAPWLKFEEAVEYAKKIAPKRVFPVHDGMLRKEQRSVMGRIVEMLLKPHDIEFIDMAEGSVQEF